MNPIIFDSAQRHKTAEKASFFRAIINFISKYPTKTDLYIAEIPAKEAQHKAESDRSILPSTYMAA